MSDAQEIARFEALAEEAYSAMYDVRASSVKELYEDALYNLGRAIDIARMRGLNDTVGRLTKRRDHIDTVYNRQFRHAGR